MIFEVDCEYAFEELHKCDYCKTFIESNYCRVVYRNKRTFYHPICFEIFRAKLEALYISYKVEKKQQ